MGIIQKRLKGYAVYWAPDGRDTFGQPTYESPIEIRVRWEAESKEFLGADGEKQISNASIGVDRQLKLLGLLWEGRMIDLVDIDPRSNPDVVEIRKLIRIPNLKHTETYREVLVV